ncbi:MAG: hypothetical protein ACRED9_04845 [Caulobacteraceae bacterium]
MAGIDIDFSKLQTPDYVGTYQNAFAAGRRLAQQTAQANALARDQPATSAMGSMAQGRAGGIPSDQALSDPLNRQRAANRAEIFTNLAAALRASPYAERSPILAHLSPVLTRMGVRPSAIAGFEPTDANIESLTAAIGRLAGGLRRAPTNLNAFS